MANSTKNWRWFLLIFELFLFALILILPQVDLPDFAFQRGSAPIVAKAKLSARPNLAIVSPTAQSARPQHRDERQLRAAKPLDQSNRVFSLSLLCTWLC